MARLARHITLLGCIALLIVSCHNQVGPTIPQDPTDPQSTDENTDEVTPPSITIADVSLGDEIANGDQIAWPNVSVGATYTRAYRITNSGGAALHLISAAVGGCEWFTCPTVVETEIAGGESATLEINVTPTATTEQTATVTVETDAQNDPVFSFSVTVTGTLLGGTLAVNGGAEFTNTRTVSLDLSPDHPQSVVSMQLSNSADFADAQTAPFSSPIEWTLSDVDEEKTVYAKLIDADGNQTETPITAAITLDRERPEAPAVPTIPTAQDAGASDSDRITNISEIDLHGVREPYATVTVESSLDGVLGTVTSGASTSWTLPVSLSDGAHSITAVQTDRAGNGSPISAPLIVTIDTEAPGAPELPDLAAEDDSGDSNGDNLTNVSAGITLSGTGVAPGDRVTVESSRDGVIATFDAAETDWELDEVSLSEGVHSITVGCTDAAGNSSDSSDPLIVTIDLTAPGAVRFASLAQGEYTMTDLRPMFSWTIDPSDGATRFQLQIDDNPDFGSPWHDSGMIAGKTYEPVSDMPVSATRPVGRRYYYRVRAQDTAGNTGPWSPDGARRYVEVGRFPQDFNGDGYSDVVVSGSGHYVGGEWSPPSVVNIYYGGTIMDTSADVSVAAEFTGYWPVASFGDLNADGYSDLVFGSSRNRSVWVTYGSAAPRRFESPDVTISQSVSGFGVGVAVGDLTGDGYADLAVAAQADGTNTFVFRGRSANLDGSPDQSFAGSFSTGYGSGLAIADVDGDSFGDLLVGVDGDSGGTVRLHQGGPAGVQSSAAQIYSISGYGTNPSFGGSVTSVGDLDADGYEEFAVSAPGADFGDGYGYGMVFVFSGGPSLPSTPSSQLYGVQASGRFGESIDAVGDMDGDGHTDLIVGTPYYDLPSSSDRGRVKVFFSAGGLSFVDANVSRNGTVGGENLGLCVSSAGDVNGDGYSDVIFGAPSYNSTTSGPAGRAFLYSGASLRQGIFTSPTTPPKEFTSPADGQHYGVVVD